ncbi:MAG: glycoside hydrolase family 18 protein [Minisyncoccota bacterium]
MAELVRFAKERGYDGLDIDYEGFRAHELAALASLVEELAAAFHSVSKSLTVSIEAQSDNVAASAWRRIGAAADEVRFMAYGTKPKTPGPLVERTWFLSCVEMAARVIPVSKFVARTRSVRA